MRQNEIVYMSKTTKFMNVNAFSIDFWNIFAYLLKFIVYVNGYFDDSAFLASSKIIV